MENIRQKLGFRSKAQVAAWVIGQKLNKDARSR